MFLFLNICVYVLMSASDTETELAFENLELV